MHTKEAPVARQTGGDFLGVSTDTPRREGTDGTRRRRRPRVIDARMVWDGTKSEEDAPQGGYRRHPPSKEATCQKHLR